MPHNAFLRAIISDPDDDLPRLVYADFLDETGDTDRAEFIRVQCRLAEYEEHDPHFRELEDREHALLATNEAEWFREREGLNEWVWRRGFVDEVADGHSNREASESLFAAQPIQRWKVQTRDVHSVLVLSKESVARLKHFDSSGLPWNERNKRIATRLLNDSQLQSYRHTGISTVLDFADSMTEAYPLSSLTELRLGGGSTYRTSLRHSLRPSSAGEALANALAKMNIAKLGLYSCELTTWDIGHILHAECGAKLTDLDVSENPIGPDGYRAFENAHPAMQLQSLDVSGTPLAGISLEPLLNARSLESLEKLEINGCGSARRNMEVLSNSAFWSQATHLRAHSGTIPSDTLEPLCKSQGPTTLRLLDLADNYLRTEGVRMLCEAPWVDSLTWLALSGNYLDDEACRIMAVSGRLRQLRTLHLSNNNVARGRGDGERITDTGVAALAMSPDFANLRILTLNHLNIHRRSIFFLLNSPHWTLSGFGVAGCDLGPPSAEVLGESRNLARLNWLDLSGNRRLGGAALRALAESPYLSPICELDCGGIDLAPDVAAIFRERLGVRFAP